MKSCTTFSKNFNPVHLARQRGSWAGEAGLAAQRRDALRGRRAPLLLSASCPQVPSQAVAAAAAAGLRSPGWLRVGTLKGARSPLAPASEAGRRGAERETLSSAARPQLWESPLRSGGEVGGRACGRAWRAVTHIHGAGGEGARAEGNPTPGGPGEGGRAEASGARWTPAPGGRARRWGSRRARRAREERSRRGADPQRPAGGRQAAREGLRAGVCNAVGGSAVGGAPEGCTRTAAHSGPGGRGGTGLPGVPRGVCS